jgi:REP element-mobilizing transposase RayT
MAMRAAYRELIVGRPPRIEIPHGYYHLVARGNNKVAVFDDELRRLFRIRLKRISHRYSWRVYAWALMTNHYHLIIQIGEAGLSRGMCELNGGVARAVNRHFGQIDHCFGRRFWSAHLETDSHLLECIRYAVWNPARAGVGEHPRDSRWTSFRSAAGLDQATSVLATDELLGLFGSTPATGREQFCQFIDEGAEICRDPSP